MANDPQKEKPTQGDQKPQEKPESTSEFEGAPTRKPSKTTNTEVKTETSQSSGQ